MNDDEVREAVVRELTKRALQKIAPKRKPDLEEANEVARWAITDMFVRHLRPTFNLNPESYERVVEEVARRLRRIDYPKR